MCTSGYGRILAIIVLAVVALFASVAGGAIIRVDPASPTNGPGGPTWSNAYHSLTAALAAANSGDQVRVAGDETYKPTSYSASFVLKAGVGESRDSYYFVPLNQKAVDLNK